MSYALVLDCNALRPHQDVSLPMAKLNPHKIIPSINPKTLDGTSSKPSSASFTLPPVVENYSSVDSGIGSSNCILDPAKYMWTSRYFSLLSWWWCGGRCCHGDVIIPLWRHQNTCEPYGTTVCYGRCCHGDLEWFQKCSCARSSSFNSWAVVIKRSEGTIEIQCPLKTW